MVCDGVGGWGDLGVCSGKFSKFLTNKVRELYESSTRNEKRQQVNTEDPKGNKIGLLKDILVEGVKANPNGGSTTAVMVEILANEKSEGRSATLKTCNLGDSAYMVLRPSNKS